MGTIITRDGLKVAGPFEDENRAFGALLRLQPMSCDWAMKHEGYGIRDEEDPEPVIEVRDTSLIGDPVVARFDSETEALGWLHHQNFEDVKGGRYEVDVPEPCCYVNFQTRGQQCAVDCDQYQA